MSAFTDPTLAVLVQNDPIGSCKTISGILDTMEYQEAEAYAFGLLQRTLSGVVIDHASLSVALAQYGSRPITLAYKVICSYMSNAEMATTARVPQVTTRPSGLRQNLPRQNYRTMTDPLLNEWWLSNKTFSFTSDPMDTINDHTMYYTHNEPLSRENILKRILASFRYRILDLAEQTREQVILNQPFFGDSPVKNPRMIRVEDGATNTMFDVFLVMPKSARDTGNTIAITDVRASITAGFVSVLWATSA